MTNPFLRSLAVRALAVALMGAAATPALADKTFALVQINQQALFFNEMNRGAQEAADDADVSLVIFNANNDPAAQNSAIETHIQQGVDGIAVVASDVNGIMAAVEQAAEAGIPVVAIDAILPDGPHQSQIGVDNAKAGADMGAKMLSDTGGTAKVGIVGALNSFIQNVRQKGFEDAVSGTDGVEIAGTVDGRNVQDNALSAAENLITANPDLTAIYATGEPALLGAIAAVESQGKEDEIAVFGWDLTGSVIDGIDTGFVKAVVQQDPSLMGAAAVDALMTLSDGGSVEPVLSVPVEIVTKENVDPYRDLFK